MASEQFFPISEISTYHSRWTIRARVTEKGQLRSFNGRDGKPVQVFSVHLLDESSSEIRANFFGAMCDQYHPKIELGKCYTFTRGSVRIANRQYNRCNHRYELTFDRDGAVEEVGDIGGIDTVKYSFIDLHALGAKAVPATFDLCGVIVSFRPTHSFTSQAGKELVKREIVLADDTATSIAVALWGERAQQEDKVFEGHPVCCLKGVSVREWNGTKSGSLMEAGIMDMASKLPEAERLREWWSKTGPSVISNLTALSASSGGNQGLCSIRSLLDKTLPCSVDLLAVVVSAKPVYAFTSRDGKELVKRDVLVADDSGASISITLWGDRAKQDDKVFENNVSISLKGVAIKDWNGSRGGSILENGQMVVGPETAEAEKLQTWWKSGGSSQTLLALSQEGAVAGGGRSGPIETVTMAEAKSAIERVGTETVIMNVVCRLSEVMRRRQGEPMPLTYMACQEPREGTTLTCNKRVTEDGFCAACNRHGKTAVRANLRCKYADFSESHWLTTFHEPAQAVLRMTADSIRGLEKGEGREELENRLRHKYFSEPINLKVRAKLDTYNGETRPNASVMEAKPVNKSLHGRAMLKSIKEMITQLTGSLQVGGA